MSLRASLLSSYIAYSADPPLLPAAISWGCLLLSQLACACILRSALQRERHRSRPRIGHVPLICTMLASCACSCCAVGVLYGSIWLTPKGSEIPIAGSPQAESSASVPQRVAAEALLAAYALLQMMAFIGFAASKMLTLLLLFTVTIGRSWDQLFLFRAHSLLKRCIAALSILLMASTAVFVFFHFRSVLSRIQLDQEAASSNSRTNSSHLMHLHNSTGTQLQLDEDYQRACASEAALLMSQAVFLAAVLLGLTVAVVKVKPVSYDGGDLAQPMLAMTDTWLFNSQFGRRIAAAVFSLVFLLIGRSALSLILGTGILGMNDACDAEDVLQCQSLSTIFALWFFKAPWPQPVTFILSETVGACLSLSIIHDGSSDRMTTDSESNVSVSLTDGG